MDSSSPDETAPAADQTDRLILEVARTELGLGANGGADGDLVVLDDATGALTRAALDALEGTQHRVVVQETSVQHALALAEEHRGALGEGRLLIAGLEDAPADLATLLAGRSVHLALARLPKALAALEVRASSLARAGVPALIAGGRVKHMTRSQNEVLAEVYDEVHATRGLGKSRALVARTARDDLRELPPRSSEVEIAVRGMRTAVTLSGIGSVFGGASADAGSLLLLDALDQAISAGEIEDTTRSDGADGESDGAPEEARAATPGEGSPAVLSARSVIDLGSGNGLLAAYLRSALPAARLLATDDDLDAVASTRATLESLAADAATSDGAVGTEESVGVDAGGRPGEARVLWEASLAGQAADSADLVLLNPPFHDGAAIDATLVQGLLDAVARVLRPGGQLWFVHNSHLRYRHELESRIGSVQQRARDRRFTVLQATRS
ncbi:16S rRNA methyltransferase [Brachybacterium endophyticum]|uniref:16S rRNA methyltransferase n=1 Tax=Brachybacterium endophyticum TaxID=2182385 RepID=A0A2U2RPU3_9MICO|nr:methyltransferase [Brachybacterium endophyticum]PWH07825.1 16S rRNA methyltransferase [Brachybacterium endophyticum]